MTKFLAVALSIVLFLSFSGPAMAKASEDMTKQIDRGAKNIITAPLEIPKAIIKISKEQNVFFGVLFGPIQGLCNFFSKVTSGTTDVVTSPKGSKDGALIKSTMIENTASATGK